MSDTSASWELPVSFQKCACVRIRVKNMNTDEWKGHGDTRQNLHPGPERCTNSYEMYEYAS